MIFIILLLIFHGFSEKIQPPERRLSTLVSIGSRSFCPKKRPADDIFQGCFLHKTVGGNLPFAGFITVKTIITAHVAETGRGL